MIILGIETSCDETSVAVLDIKDSNAKVMSNIVSSQIALHTHFGGVVPAIAAREHVQNINHVLDAALKKARPGNIDLIAVTSGPGLVSSLLIGTAFAQTYAWKNSLPIIGVNHMEGHIYSNWLELAISENIFPALCLVVSGGHTQLILMKDHGTYELVGQTLDDAAGEAFDKIARILGLDYPGGPAIARLADTFDPAQKKLSITLPRPMLHSGNYNFSFSGLKTAVLYGVRKLLETHAIEDIQQEVAYEAQRAIVETLIIKTIKAAREYNVKTIMLSGGVSANELLRKALQQEGNSNNISVLLPPKKYTTDNAAMIAMAGYFNYQKLKKENRLHEAVWNNLRANANWEIV